MGCIIGPDLSFLPNTEMLTYRFGWSLRSSSNVVKLRLVILISSYNWRSFISMPREPFLLFIVVMVCSSLVMVCVTERSMDSKSVLARFAVVFCRLSRVESIFPLLFANVPVTGAFNYRNQFQILPSPPEAPRPPFVLGLHPMTLEVKYGGSIDLSIDIRQALHNSPSRERI